MNFNEGNVTARKRTASGSAALAPSCEATTPNFTAAQSHIPFDVNLFLRKTLSNFQLSGSSEQQMAEIPHRRPVTAGQSCNDCSTTTSKDQISVTSNTRWCAYCGVNVIRNSGLYCSDCIRLLTNKPKVSRILRQQEEDEEMELMAAAAASTERTTLLVATTVPQPAIRPPASERRLPSRPSTPSGHVVGNITHSSSFDIHRKPSLSSSKLSLASQSSSSRPLCRICQAPGEKTENLVSPCRCSGTMKFVHKSCLVHWLEISTKKSVLNPRCELCGYQYRTNRCITPHKLHLPEFNHRDRILNLVFIIMMFVMLGSAALSIVYLQGNSGTERGTLGAKDIIIIAACVLFFLAFFVAVFTQYRADVTLFNFLFRCWIVNKHWRIKNYDPQDDKTVYISFDQV